MKITISDFGCVDLAYAARIPSSSGRFVWISYLQSQTTCELVRHEEQQIGPLSINYEFQIVMGMGMGMGMVTMGRSGGLRHNLTNLEGIQYMNTPYIRIMVTTAMVMVMVMAMPTDGTCEINGKERIKKVW